ncbi:MAG: hypothetical protein JWR15_3364 [Prosthecobacter sp.]|nr:hypothetical protein [Prosthecobacter sp.]
MGAARTQKGSFEKVGECLDRYSSNEIYYAVMRHSGKLIRRSLETSDNAHAKRCGPHRTWSKAGDIAPQIHPA